MLFKEKNEGAEVLAMNTDKRTVAVVNYVIGEMLKYGQDCLWRGCMTLLMSVLRLHLNLMPIMENTIIVSIYKGLSSKSESKNL